jgi:hypothetical protein
VVTSAEAIAGSISSETLPLYVRVVAVIGAMFVRTAPEYVQPVNASTQTVIIRYGMYALFICYVEAGKKVEAGMGQ